MKHMLRGSLDKVRLPQELLDNNNETQTERVDDAPQTYAEPDSTADQAPKPTAGSASSTETAVVDDQVDSAEATNNAITQTPPAPSRFTSFFKH